MRDEFKVAAVVVLYNPELNVLFNIGTYCKSVNRLIVVDNSEKPDHVLRNNLAELVPDAICFFLERNDGIAAALNIAAEAAIELECDWLLTMDQDSNFKDNQAAQLISGISSINVQFGEVGIISPHHALHEGHHPATTDQYSMRNIVMTSGNLLNLKAYKDVGPFEEKLFMDFVDYEYCLRLKKNGYKLIQDNLVHLNHSLGNYSVKKLFTQNIGVSNHNALRRYYMTRNGLYVAFKYFSYDTKFFLFTLWNVFFWNFFIIISFEKNKVAKLKSVCNGIYHFIFNKYGKAV